MNALRLAEEFAIQILKGREGWSNFWDEYATFYRRADRPNAFQFPGWLHAWYRTLGRRFEPVILVVRQAGEWKAVWPFFEFRIPLLGKALWPAAADTNDLFDPVCTSDAKEGILLGLKELLTHWRLLWLPLVSRQFADWFTAEESAWKRQRLHFCLRRRTVRYLIDLQKVINFERYQKEVLPGEVRNLLRRKRGRVARAGGVVLNWGAGSERTELLRAIDRVIDLGKTTWQSQKGKGPFRDAENREFFRAGLAAAVAAGVCRLSALELDGRLAAFEVGFLHNCIYSMQTTGYSADFSIYSPGSVLMFHNIEWSFCQGLRWYDFLQNEQEYKRGMANCAEELMDLTILPRRAWSWAVIGFLRFFEKRAQQRQLRASPLPQKTQKRELAAPNPSLRRGGKSS